MSTGPRTNKWKRTSVANEYEFDEDGGHGMSGTVRIVTGPAVLQGSLHPYPPDNERMETVVEGRDAATGECHRVKSWRAAQLAITKHVKEKSIEST